MPTFMGASWKDAQMAVRLSRKRCRTCSAAAILLDRSLCESAVAAAASASAVSVMLKCDNNVGSAAEAAATRG